jgi:hypothetical protein
VWEPTWRWSSLPELVEAMRNKAREIAQLYGWVCERTGSYELRINALKKLRDFCPKSAVSVWPAQRLNTDKYQ